MANYGQLALRPWRISQHYLALMVNGHVCHFDLYCYVSRGTGAHYFRVIVSRAGRVPIAESKYRYDPAAMALVEVSDIPRGDLESVYWRRDTNAQMFARVHGPLIAACRLPDGYTRRALMAHYIEVADAEALPSVAGEPRKLRGRVPAPKPEPAPSPQPVWIKPRNPNAAKPGPKPRAFSLPDVL